jgi:hypothetical protein
MKTNRQLNRITQLALCGAFFCASPLAFADRQPRANRAPEDESARLEARSRVEPGRHTITKDYIRQRLDWLRFKDRRHARVLVFFDTLLGEGYDPFLLDTWLDGIYDGVIVVGMPEDLVLDYWGQPVFTDEIVFDGAPAQEWGVRLQPGRVEKVTVTGGNVVRVHG